MNKYEKRRIYQFAEIQAMIEYAESVNPNRDSVEYQQALWDWVNLYLDDFRKNWEAENGKLEDIL